MSIFKRILLFIGALVVLQTGASMIGGAIAGGIVGAHSPNQDVPRLAMQESMLFAARYRPIIFACALVLSAMLAFGVRFLTLLFSVPIAIIGFLGLQRLSTFEEAQIKTMQFPLPAASLASAIPTPTLSSKHAVLLTPITIQVRYGQTRLPRGAAVTILSQSDTSAEVRAPDGSTFSVPLTQLQH